MLIPCSRLLAEGRNDETPVARRGGEIVRFGRFRAETAHVARRIRERGVRKALLVTEDAYDFAVGMLGLLHAGAEIALPPHARPDALKAFAEGCEAVVSDMPREGIETILISGETGEDRLERVDADAALLAFHTSGSTGAPKRIVRSLGMLEREVEALEHAWGAEIGPAPVLGTVTHQHAFGLPFKLLWPLSTGRWVGAAVFHVWETLLDELPADAVIISSPAHLTRLGGLRPLRPERRPRLVFTAGAPLPAAAAIDTATIFGTAPVEIYGSTETGAVAWRRGAQEPGLWRPLEPVSVGATTEGLLSVATPFAGEACEPGDGVELASDGRFRLRGRADRIVKVEGKRVSLPEIENQISALPWIAEAAVAVVTGRRTIVGAVAVLTDAGRAELLSRGKFRFERLLRSALVSVQDPMALPRRWRFVEMLPLDGMGKRSAAETLRILGGEEGRERQSA